MSSTLLSALRAWWLEHHGWLLRAAVAILAVFALLKLGSEFWRLVWDSSRIAAIDLKFRHIEVQRWFAGLPVYSYRHGAVYPPATYAMLWPLVGWLNFTAARWVWAASSVVMLAWLTWLIASRIGADAPVERAFVALLLLSMNATGVAIGNGQLIVHCLCLLLTGLFVLRRGRRVWREDLVAAGLILLALMKPSITAFFFWGVLLFPGRLRPATLVVCGYIALTLFAATFQGAGISALITAWLQNSSGLATHGGYADLDVWLAEAGLARWGLPASLLALVLLGVWTYIHRTVDVWLILGVTSAVARLAVYHLVYDDLLMLLPMLALFRIAKRGAPAEGRDVLAGILLAIMIVIMLAPARLQFPTSPWLPLFVTIHAVVWLVVLLFLLRQAWLDHAHVGLPLARGELAPA